jgi:hypothetical protein
MQLATDWPVAEDLLNMVDQARRKGDKERTEKCFRSFKLNFVITALSHISSKWMLEGSQNKKALSIQPNLYVCD